VVATLKMQKTEAELKHAREEAMQNLQKFSVM
jgi:hypothetical protein